MQPRTEAIQLPPLRAAGTAMLAAAAVWPWLPVHPSLACPLRATTGVPCPFCGMTRAVTAAVHGDVTASLRYNPAGIVLVALALAMLLTWRVARVRELRVPVRALVAASALLWTWNVAFNPTF